jgi:hypothetical protein
MERVSRRLEERLAVILEREHGDHVGLSWTEAGEFLSALEVQSECLEALLGLYSSIVSRTPREALCALRDLSAKLALSGHWPQPVVVAEEASRAIDSICRESRLVRDAHMRAARLVALATMLVLETVPSATVSWRLEDEVLSLSLRRMVGRRVVGLSWRVPMRELRTYTLQTTEEEIVSRIVEFRDMKETDDGESGD